MDVLVLFGHSLFSTFLKEDRPVESYSEDELKKIFQLNINVYQEVKPNPDFSILDIVGLKEEQSGFQKALNSIFNSPAGNIILRQTFLYIILEENLTDIEKKSTFMKLRLLNNIKKFISSGILPEEEKNEALIDRLSESINKSTLEAYKNLSKDHFGEVIQFIENNKISPIILEDFLDPDGVLNIEKFLPLFKDQVKTNCGNLEKLYSVFIATIQPSLDAISVSEDYSSENITRLTKKQKKSLEKNIEKMKLLIMDFLEIVTNHVVFCSNSLGDIVSNLHLFKHAKVFHYFQKHQQELTEIFSENIPELPFSMVNLPQLKDDSINIPTELEFQRKKRIFNNLITITNKISEKIPETWPQELPNFSSHDLKPSIKVKNSEEFINLLQSYDKYIENLESLKKSWMFIIKNLHGFLEKICIDDD